MTEEEYEYKYIEAFTRFGLKRVNVQSANTPAAKDANRISLRRKNLFRSKKTVILP